MIEEKLIVVKDHQGYEKKYVITLAKNLIYIWRRFFTLQITDTDFYSEIPIYYDGEIKSS